MTEVSQQGGNDHEAESHSDQDQRNWQIFGTVCTVQKHKIHIFTAETQFTTTTTTTTTAAAAAAATTTTTTTILLALPLPQLLVTTHNPERNLPSTNNPQAYLNKVSKSKSIPETSLFGVLK